MRSKDICKYAAGLFDGEGYVRLATYTYKNHPTRQKRYQVFAGINMCDPRPLQVLHKHFGGSFHVMRAYSEKTNHRTLFGWNISSQKANAFFRIVFPYLIVKKDEVKLALKYQAFMKHARGKQISATRTGDTEAVKQIMAFKTHTASELNRLKRVRFDPNLIAKVPKLNELSD